LLDLPGFRRILRALIVPLAAVAVLLFAAPAGAETPRVRAIHFDASVDPVSQDWLSDQLQKAEDGHYDAAVILLDTPGGLSDSMRKIVQDELALKIPVIVYVSPPGARAASAGVWIGQAADLLAMAPETNIGSSTPISSGGQNIPSDLRRKVINDAVASLSALAAAHGRNAAWAKKAVKEASNLDWQTALRLHVIDMVAPNLQALLAKSDGFRTKAPARHYTLHLEGASVVDVKMGFFTRFLGALIDPNVISLLFLAGIAGIGFEIFHPGVVLPGALGAVALVTSLFGFSVLPISWAGLALLLLGIALIVIDLFVASHGAITVAGLTCLAVGAIMLFHNAPQPFHASVPLVVTVAAVLGGLWVFLISKALAVRRHPVAVGPQDILGRHGEVRRDGLVAVRGELWQARSVDGTPLVQGQEVEVTGIEGGLVLDVQPVREPVPH
jgi:membrane-bound serine protease (ClpP class)